MPPHRSFSRSDNVRRSARSSIVAPSVSRKACELLLEPAEQAVDNRLPVLFINRFGKGDVHRADLHTVLCVAAVGDAVLAHNPFETLIAGHPTGSVHVEEANLGDRLG